MINNVNRKSIEIIDGSLSVSGDLDFMTVMDVWQQSLPLLSQCDILKFDFSRVSHANSSALALLLEWLKYAKQAKKPIFFEQMSDHLKSIAVVAGIDKLLLSPQQI
jgi:ABC-type transporter Mla MlaB component